MKLFSVLCFCSIYAFGQVSVGDMAKDFSLTNESEKSIKLSDYKGKIIVLEWLNHGCPFVRKHYDSGNMQMLQKKYKDDVVWFSIVSSSEGKQGYVTPAQAAADKMDNKSMAMNILLDTKGSVGQDYGAKTTPHMFIIGKDFKLKYMGAIDSKPSTDQDDIKGSDNYISLALDSMLKGEEVKVAKTKAYGCSVKY